MHDWKLFFEVMAICITIWGAIGFLVQAVRPLPDRRVAAWFLLLLFLCVLIAAYLSEKPQVVNAGPGSAGGPLSAGPLAPPTGQGPAGGFQGGTLHPAGGASGAGGNTFVPTSEFTASVRVLGQTIRKGQQPTPVTVSFLGKKDIVARVEYVNVSSSKSHRIKFVWTSNNKPAGNETYDVIGSDGHIESSCPNIDAVESGRSYTVDFLLLDPSDSPLRLLDSITFQLNPAGSFSNN